MKVYRQMRITTLVCKCKHGFFFQCEEIADISYSSFDFPAIIIH